MYLWISPVRGIKFRCHETCFGLFPRRWFLYFSPGASWDSSASSTWNGRWGTTKDMAKKHQLSPMKLANDQNRGNLWWMTSSDHGPSILAHRLLRQGSLRRSVRCLRCMGGIGVHYASRDSNMQFSAQADPENKDYEYRHEGRWLTLHPLRSLLRATSVDNTGTMGMHYVRSSAKQ